MEQKPCSRKVLIYQVEEKEEVVQLGRAEEELNLWLYCHHFLKTIKRWGTVVVVVAAVVNVAVVVVVVVVVIVEVVVVGVILVVVVVSLAPL